MDCVSKVATFVQSTSGPGLFKVSGIYRQIVTYHMTLCYITVYG